MDKITAITSVSRNLRDLIADTIPSSLAATHMHSANLVHPVTDQLKGKDAYIYSGAAAGQERIVTAFTPRSGAVNGILQFAQPFGSVPSVNSRFLVFDYWTKPEYDNAIDRMIGLSELKYLRETVATISIVPTQYEYSVPSGYEYISTLRLVPSGGSNYSDYDADDEVQRLFELPSRYWRIEANPLGTFVIAFDPQKIDLDDFDGQAIRIMGQAKADAIGTDNATIPRALEEYLIAGASMILASQRIGENQEWRIKFGMFRDMTQGLEDSIFRPRRGRRVG